MWDTRYFAGSSEKLFYRKEQDINILIQKEENDNNGNKVKSKCGT